MSIIDIPDKVHAYIHRHDGITPPCFAVALDAVTNGKMSYDAFDQQYPDGPHLVAQEALVEGITFQGKPIEWGMYSVGIARMFLRRIVPSMHERLVETSVQTIFSSSPIAAVIVSEPGSRMLVNHARAVTSATQEQALLWNAQEPVVSTLDQDGLRDLLRRCLEHDESHVFTIGFKVLYDDLIGPKDVCFSSSDPDK